MTVRTYETMRTDTVLRMVAQHRNEQERRWPGQTPAGDLLDDFGRLAILLEEVGEVAREFNERRAGCLVDETYGVRTERLRVELVQVAAVAVAWAESLL